MEPNLCATFPSNYTFASLLIKTTSKRRKSKPTFFRASQAENERFNLSEQRKKIHFCTITLTFLRVVIAGVTPACSSLGFISFVIFSTSLIHIQWQDNTFFVRSFSHLATFCKFICSSLKHTNVEIMHFFSLWRMIQRWNVMHGFLFIYFFYVCPAAAATGRYKMGKEKLYLWKCSRKLNHVSAPAHKKGGRGIKSVLILDKSHSKGKKKIKCSGCV